MEVEFEASSDLDIEWYGRGESLLETICVIKLDNVPNSLYLLVHIDRDSSNVYVMTKYEHLSFFDSLFPILPNDMHILKVKSMLHHLSSVNYIVQGKFRSAIGRDGKEYYFDDNFVYGQLDRCLINLNKSESEDSLGQFNICTNKEVEIVLLDKTQMRYNQKIVQTSIFTVKLENKIYVKQFQLAAGMLTRPFVTKPECEIYFDSNSAYRTQTHLVPLSLLNLSDPSVIFVRQRFAESYEVQQGWPGYDVTQVVGVSDLVILYIKTDKACYKIYTNSTRRSVITEEEFRQNAAKHPRLTSMTLLSLFLRSTPVEVLTGRLYDKIPKGSVRKYKMEFVGDKRPEGQYCVRAYLVTMNGKHYLCDNERFRRIYNPDSKLEILTALKCHFYDAFMSSEHFSQAVKDTVYTVDVKVKEKGTPNYELYLPIDDPEILNLRRLSSLRD